MAYRFRYTDFGTTAHDSFRSAGIRGSLETTRSTSETDRTPPGDPIRSTVRPTASPLPKVCADRMTATASAPAPGRGAPAGGCRLDITSNEPPDPPPS